jgi:hypothetical protein
MMEQGAVVNRRLAQKTVHLFPPLSAAAISDVHFILADQGQGADRSESDCR